MARPDSSPTKPISSSRCGGPWLRSATRYGTPSPLAAAEQPSAAAKSAVVSFLRIATSVFLQHLGERRVEAHVVGVEARSLAVEVELQVHALAEDEAVGRSAKVEHAQLVALFHPLAGLDRELAARHYGHPHRDHAHQPDLG